jgi:putative peptide zinc metalloprotease protein
MMPAEINFLSLVGYELLERWSLADAEALIDAVNSETTLNVDLHDVENLLKFLIHNYLIKQSGYQIYKNAKEQKLFKKDNLFHWVISYYLFFRVPLVHPDHFLTKTKKIGDWVFSRIAGYVMLVLALIALFQLSMQWEQFTHTFSTIFTWQGLFFYFLAYLICKFCHELGHAYMCKHYGVPVPSLGVAFLVFWPVLYTDTTLSWSLSSHQRLRIALAGIWVETYVTIIALFLWCNVHNLTIQAICYVTISVNWVASLLINVSPFMRFDGYYVFADFLKMPNLQPRAFALTRWQIRRWLFNWPDPPPEKFSLRRHNLLVAYSFMTWIYRLTVYFGIALLVYHFFVKIIGILLFAIELFYFILGPIVAEIQSWLFFKNKFTFNIRTKFTCFFIALCVLLIFLPINETIKMPGTLSYAHQFLIAPDEGVIETKLPAIGSAIKANQPIVQISSSELNHSLQKARLEYQKISNELRRASINPQYASQKSILLSDINKQQATFNKLVNQYAKFILSVPFDGVLIDVASDLYRGTVVMKDEWIGDIIQPSIVQGEAFVSQIDINNLQVGLTGYFYPNHLSQSAVPIKISAIEVLNASKLNCYYSKELKQNKKADVVIDTQCYNASDLGGGIATFFTDEGEYVPVNSVFRVLFTTEKPVKLTHVERGTVFIKAKPNSYGARIFYKLKTTWMQQIGF